jgi:hypothetical protein
VRRCDTMRCSGSTQLRRSKKSRTEQVRPKVGKDRVLDHCMIRGDGNEMMSFYSGVCRMYTPNHSDRRRYPWISGPPPSLFGDVLGGRNQACWKRNWETEIERTKRYPYRPGLSEFGDALGDRGIERTQRCTWKP